MDALILLLLWVAVGALTYGPAVRWAHFDEDGFVLCVIAGPVMLWAVLMCVLTDAAALVPYARWLRRYTRWWRK